MSFRDHLVKAAEAQFQDGNLSRRELRQIRFFSAIPSVCDRLEKAAREELKLDQTVAVMDASGAIDWSGLAAFLKEILPIIIEIIKMFLSMSQPNHQSEAGV